MKKDWKVWLLMAIGATVGAINGADFAQKLPEQIRNVTGKKTKADQEETPEGE